MALVANTVSRYDAYRSVREELADVIYNISPTDTPFMSNIGRDSARNTFSEWQTDSLRAPDLNNAQLEGDDVSGVVDPAQQTNRVGNYSQISRKIVASTGTVEALDKAGMRSALAYQLAKNSSELKRDLEAILTTDQVAVVGNNTTARKTAAIGAWIITNFFSVGSGAQLGVAPVMSSGSDGYPATAPVAATTKGVPTEDNLKTMIQNVWTQGGSVNRCFVMCGPHNKKVISGFSGIATRFRDTSPGKQAQIIGAADIYVSDFGTVSVVPNRFQPEDRIYMVNPDYAAVSYVRNFHTEPLAKTGDATKRMILVEYLLKVRTERAFGIIRDCATS